MKVGEPGYGSEEEPAKSDNWVDPKSLPKGPSDADYDRFGPKAKFDKYEKRKMARPTENTPLEQRRLYKNSNKRVVNVKDL